MTTCNGPNCGAEVMFVPSGKSGKQMILDATPKKGIVLRVFELPTRETRTGRAYRSQVRAVFEDVYTDHHATCPDAERFRKPRST